MPGKVLTKKQEEILEYFYGLAYELGYFPSQNELEEYTGITRESIRFNWKSKGNLIKYLKENYELEGEILDEEGIHERNKKNVAEAYANLVKKVKLFPTYNDLRDVGITKETIKHYFGTLLKLRKYTSTNFPNHFKGLISIEDYDSDKVDKEIKKYKRFFITTAVTGQWCDSKFLNSVKKYCKNKKAKLLVLPSHDPAHNLDNSLKWHFDPEIPKDSIVFHEVKLNSNIRISDIRVTAKQINPTTGLSRLSQGKGSFIFASPKQHLEMVPVSNNKLPHALLATGACTISNYKTSRANSLRTAHLAEYDHEIAGIVVEVVDNEIFHYRPIQSDDSGGFYDLGTYYGKSNKKRGKSTIILGDSHAGEHDLGADKAWKSIIKEANISEVIFHDLFNGASISHHEKDNIIERAIKAESNLLSLKEELKITGDYLASFALKGIKKLTIVKSNHDEFLERWIRDGRFSKDPYNFEVGCKLADSLLHRENPVELGVLLYSEKYRKVYENEKIEIQWLDRDEDYIKAGFQCGAHGDKGANGSRASKVSLEKSYGKCIIGHSHTPGKLRKVFQVGTSSLLDLGYNIGPSSWAHTSAILYEDIGEVQLINSIEGNYKLKK